MDSAIIMSFLTLCLLEIVLGIDNLIFIALVVEKLPEKMRARARNIGLLLALVIRVGMLAGLSWVMGLTEPIITIDELALSFRDLLLIGGGIFLLAKTTTEIHADVADKHDEREISVKNTFAGAITQIVIIDFVFSFDSIMTAVGIAQQIWVMVAAVVVSMIVMVAASGWISGFLRKYPTFKMLALSFILMIGMVLVAEGLHFHIPKAYIYCAFSFSLFVEFLNTLWRKKNLAK